MIAYWEVRVDFLMVASVLPAPRHSWEVEPLPEFRQVSKTTAGTLALSVRGRSRTRDMICGNQIGSVQNFSSLQDDVERGTRSNKVMVYDFETFQGWRERAREMTGAKAGGRR
jgi:hypothetical protein